MSLTILIGTVLVVSSGCSSLERASKDIKSEYGGGLNRIVTVYDNAGHVIRTYEGRIDIANQTDSEGGTTGSDKVKFEVNGKRVILYNATVVVEEK
ncbi:DUF5052 family protein [Bacillus sp. MUM 116]|uniref:DUF5052 family protein n=1 Tax=Bacillus sp. MUM 116 TaxID=1678002 RepID=UPI0015A513A8|nr:DUF5052 family protein [Bacillus sp. MUM 116]